MFNREAAAVGVLALASFLGGCGPNQTPEKTETERVEAAAKEIGYQKVNDNTYIVFGGAPDGPPRYARNIDRFRREVPGDFILEPICPRDPTWYDSVMIRKTVESKGGTNTITGWQTER